MTAAVLPERSAAVSSAALLRAVVESSPFGLAVLDLEARIELWNAAAERISGWPARQVLGATYPTQSQAALAVLRAQVRRVAASREVLTVEGRYYRRHDVAFDGRLTIAPIDAGEGVVERVIVTVQDVTAERAAEARLRRRDRVLQAISSAGRRLLWDGTLARGFSRALTELGPAAEASRAWVMERVVTADGRTCLACSWEWCAEGIEPQIGNPEVQLTDVEATGISDWLTLMAEGEPLAYTLAELPPVTQRLLAPQRILSLAMAPILVEGELWGLVGYDDCVEERRWSGAELDALRAVAELFGAAIRRSRVEAELRQAKEQAEAASVAKSDFLARMSHELRTPLTSVIGFTNVLRKRLAPEFAEEEYVLLQRVGANAVHLLSLINDLLDISKVEAGKLEVAHGEVDVSALVRETVAEFAGARETVQLLLELPASCATIRSDAAKLKQVLLNLVGNAFKFTEFGTVTVRLEVGGDGRPRALHVADTGIGIAPERLAGIFDAFEQADAGTSRRYGGTGLGLTISRALCRLVGCELGVASEPGRGSTFTVHFPGGGAGQ